MYVVEDLIAVARRSLAVQIAKALVKEGLATDEHASAAVIVQEIERFQVTAAPLGIAMEQAK